MAGAEQAPPGIDTTKPHPARRYDYWLGGKDNYAADRASAAEVEAGFPTIALAARENRKFLGRLVRHLAAEEGIRQFLDIGAGLPAADNVHEVAQSVDPLSRVVYVDSDPIVLAHARALLQGSPDGATAYIDADMRDPEGILAHPSLRATLDLSRPVALTMLAVLHFIEDQDLAHRIVGTLRAVLPSGSFVAVTHATSDYLTPEEIEGTRVSNRRSGVEFRLRSTAEFTEFFTDLDLVPPGITSVLRWHPPVERTEAAVQRVSMLCGVGRVP